jgi:predicted nuclease of predicted toxin-antitoxin system
LKLLVDENLPLELARSLGLDAVHATELGIRLTDSQIWDEAKRLGCVLVTKDADFFDRMALIGPPPQVVWARFGNMRRNDIISLFVRDWPQIAELLISSDLVEVFINRIEGVSFPRQ